MCWQALPPLEKKPAAAPPKRKVAMMYDFEPAADDAEGLAAREGETLVVSEESEDGEWLKCVNARGESGYVPKNYTEPSYRPD